MSLLHSYQSRKAAWSNDPARLDKRVTLQFSTPTQDLLGGVVAAWSELATVWASMLPLPASRFFQAEGKHMEQMFRFRIRHRSDVQAFMRLIHGDDVFEILGAEELGRRHFLELTCRAVDQTTGDSRPQLDAGNGTAFIDAGDDSTLIDTGVAA